MADYEKCQRAYRIGATKDQIKVWVKASKITPEQYEEITGEPYGITENSIGGGTWNNRRILIDQATAERLLVDAQRLGEAVIRI